MGVERSPTTKTKSNSAQNSDEEGPSADEELRREWARLNEEREKLEQMRAEIEAARASGPPAENTRARGRGRAPINQQGDTDDRVVSGVISHLQYLQLDVKPPKFSDENVSNPNEFLVELEKFFQFKNVKEEHKVIVTESLLDGRARIWANSGAQIFRNFKGFREAFLNEFYSIPIRAKLKNQWLSRRYRANDGSYQEYFYKQLRNAKYFEPELTTYEITFSVIQQFPSRVREALASVNYENTEAVLQVLARLDALQRERDGDRRHNNAWEGNQNNYANNYPAENQYHRRVQQIQIGRTQDQEYRNSDSRNNSFMYNNRTNGRNHFRYQQQQARASYIPYQRYPVMPDTRYPPPNYQSGPSGAGVNMNDRTNDLNTRTTH